MSDEVTDFLRSVEQLKDRRIEEDEARSRELEEKILQDKRERQARRAERARSISPQKSSPANTPPPTASSAAHHHHRYGSSQASADARKTGVASSPTALGSPRSPTARTAHAYAATAAGTAASNNRNNSIGLSASSAALADALDAPPAASSSPTKENEAPTTGDAEFKTLAGSALARTPTLSWQRRPPSGGSPLGSPGLGSGSGSGSGAGSDRPRSRPLSVVAAENAAARSSSSVASPSGGGRAASPVASDANDDGGAPAPASRSQIAQALSAKDPSWFRQTPDRGLSSAAYRRAQVEDDDRQDLTAAAARAALPGMSRSPSVEPEAGGVAGVAGVAGVVGGRLGSPSLQLTPTPKLDPPRDVLTSPSPLTSGRTSPTRPLSPTKGAGGFVQSAMMKRSDSVKRWSVTSPPGLQRADSIASTRAALEGGGGSPRRAAAASMSGGNGGSPSRPGSSHGGRESANNSRPSTPTRLQTRFPAGDEAAAKSNAAADDDKKAVATPPASPSKTMDPRRWSPTKSSSWLDAALNKPESPKPKAAPPPNNQPAWMVELSKAKAQKAGGNGSSNPPAPSSSAAPTAATLAETTRTPPSVVHKHEVKTGGLLRSTPMGGGRGGAATATATPASASALSPSPAAAIGPGRTAGLASLRSPSPSIGARLGSPSPAAAVDVGGGGAPLPKASTASAPSDFRAVLKPRQPLPSSDKKDERTDGSSGGTEASGNELQSVFGTLRRTKTQNYVAPDVLKENILRGKKSLNFTGGPKPREKTDELKEAILRKKAEFNQAKTEGRGVATNVHAASSSFGSNSSDQPLPEGVAKRLELNKTGGSAASSVSARRDSSPSKPAVAELPIRSRSSTVSASLARTASVAEAAAPPAEPKDDRPAAKAFGSVGRVGGSALANRFNPALAGLLARGPPGTAPGGGPSGGNAAPASVSASASAPSSDDPVAAEPGPGPQLTHMTKGRARGPRRKAPTSLQSKQPAAAEKQPAAKPQPAPVVSTPTKSPPPTASKKPELAAASPASSPSVPEPATSSAYASPVVPLVDSSKTMQATAASPAASGAGVHLVVDSPQPMPTTSVGSPSASVRSPTQLMHGQVAAAAAAAKATPAPKPAVGRKPSLESKPTAATEKRVDEAAAPASQPSSPRKIDVKRMSRFLEEAATKKMPGPADVGEAPPPRPLSPSKTGGALGGARPLPEPRPLSPQKTGGSSFSRPSSTAPAASAASASPAPTSSRKDGPAGLASPSPSTPASAGSFRPKMFADAPARASPPPQEPQKAQATRSPTVPMKSPTVVRRAETLSPSPKASPSPALTSPSVASPGRSPSKQAQEVSAVLKDFFGPARPGRNYRADAAAVLSARPPVDSRVRTIHAQLFRLSGDGKRQPVPAHYERVLFEREMYLCPHTFTRGSGRKATEVYFWAGDEVPAATVEDVQVFLNREARALGGTLVKLQQGKETAEFLAALGGIVTVRRGSSNKYDSLASSMFCGRRFLGQVAFDEVDFAPSSLCSGFPYLLTRQGKCYLWKGKGSNVEELSCARLIGTDLALMGEVMEVEDGREPDDFWALFEQGAGGGAGGTGGDGGLSSGKPGSAEHWRLKPKYNRYAGRLFRSDATGREQIHPFGQRDLSPDGIYVLDAFFEMYIIVGHRSQTQYAAFHNALEFAQEYAILAAGMEDRPFVPISTVVLEGIPRDLKGVFRKWSDAASPTRTATAAAAAAAAAAGTTAPSPAPIKRGRSLRVVPLMVALQALAD